VMLLGLDRAATRPASFDLWSDIFMLHRLPDLQAMLVHLQGECGLMRQS
jgi:hypothetical protein